MEQSHEEGGIKQGEIWDVFFPFPVLHKQVQRLDTEFNLHGSGTSCFGTTQTHSQAGVL